MGNGASKSSHSSRIHRPFKFTSKIGFTRAHSLTHESIRDHVPAKSVRSKAVQRLTHPKRSKDPIQPIQDTLTFHDSRKVLKLLKSLGMMQDSANKYMGSIWWQQIVMAMSIMMNSKDKKNTRKAQEASNYFYNNSGDYLQLYHHLKRLRARIMKLSKYQWRNAHNAVKYRTIRDWWNTLNSSLMEPLQLHFNELVNTGFISKQFKHFKVIPLHIYSKAKMKVRPQILHVGPSPKKK